MFHSLLLVVALVPATPDRVGQIIIIGNKVTPSDIILHRVSMVPDQIFSLADLRAAKRNLGWLQLLGIGSTVEILDTGKYKDILVTVHETPITWFLLGPSNALLARLSPSR